jgi:hypothetical protein
MNETESFLQLWKESLLHWLHITYHYRISLKTRKDQSYKTILNHKWFFLRIPEVPILTKIVNDIHLYHIIQFSIFVKLDVDDPESDKILVEQWRFYRKQSKPHENRDVKQMYKKTVFMMRNFMNRLLNLPFRRIYKSRLRISSSKIGFEYNIASLPEQQPQVFRESDTVKTLDSSTASCMHGSIGYSVSYVDNLDEHKLFSIGIDNMIQSRYIINDLNDSGQFTHIHSHYSFSSMRSSPSVGSLGASSLSNVPSIFLEKSTHEEKKIEFGIIPLLIVDELSTADNINSTFDTDELSLLDDGTMFHTDDEDPMHFLSSLIQGAPMLFPICKSKNNMNTMQESFNYLFKKFSVDDWSH